MATLLNSPRGMPLFTLASPLAITDADFEKAGPLASAHKILTQQEMQELHAQQAEAEDESASGDGMGGGATTAGLEAQVARALPSSPPLLGRVVDALDDEEENASPLIGVSAERASEVECFSVCARRGFGGGLGIELGVHSNLEMGFQSASKCIVGSDGGSGRCGSEACPGSTAPKSASTHNDDDASAEADGNQHDGIISVLNGDGLLDLSALVSPSLQSMLHSLPSARGVGGYVPLASARSHECRSSDAGVHAF